jgi:hypothetical protein
VSKNTSEYELLAAEARQQTLLLEDDPVTLLERVYQLWWHWADFSLFVIDPTINAISPPNIIAPELIPGTSDYEFVYPIIDHGYKLMTSKAPEMFVAGMSMCRLYFTIEKMMFLLIERLKNAGIATDTEVQIAFGGHQLAQRKAFESVINLQYNVIVTNFEPGEWGDRYLEIVKRLSDKGYGYPSETPRDNYRQLHGASPTKMKK